MLKQINKVYGSSTGDLLLVQICKRTAKHLQVLYRCSEPQETVFLIITDSLTEYEKKKTGDLRTNFKEPFEN